MSELPKHHQKALDDAKDWLENVDADIFLDEFIKLNQQAIDAGIPSVDEFIESFNLPDQLINK